MSESCQVCSTCEARFIGGKLYWSTGKVGDPLDLAGLVCNPYSRGRECINPCKGEKGGQTWEQRSANLDAALAEHDIKFPSLVESPLV